MGSRGYGYQSRETTQGIAVHGSKLPCGMSGPVLPMCLPNTAKLLSAHNDKHGPSMGLQAEEGYEGEQGGGGNASKEVCLSWEGAFNERQEDRKEGGGDTALGGMRGEEMRAVGAASLWGWLVAALT